MNSKTKRVSGYMRRERVDPFAEMKEQTYEQLTQDVLYEELKRVLLDERELVH